MESFLESKEAVCPDFLAQRAVIDRLESIEKTLKGLKKTVTWQDNVSDSGIQLTGVSTIARTGDLIGSNILAVGPGQFMIVYAVQSHKDGKVMILNAADVTLS